MLERRGFLKARRAICWSNETSAGPQLKPVVSLQKGLFSPHTHKR